MPYLRRHGGAVGHGWPSSAEIAVGRSRGCHVVRPRMGRVCHVVRPRTDRGAAAGATWIFHGWVAAPPRVPRGSSADGSRRRHGCHVDRPRTDRVAGRIASLRRRRDPGPSAAASTTNNVVAGEHVDSGCVLFAGVAKRRATSSSGDARPTIYTIGHALFEEEALLGTLRDRRVATLVDVRSYPNSATAPQWQRRSLEASEARRATCGYEWRGAALGGRGDERDLVAETDALDALAARTDAPICLMCAELHHANCHRDRLAGELVARGRRVVHLRADREAGDAHPQPAVPRWRARGRVETSRRVFGRVSNSRRGVAANPSVIYVAAAASPRPFGDLRGRRRVAATRSRRRCRTPNCGASSPSSASSARPRRPPSSRSSTTTRRTPGRPRPSTGNTAASAGAWRARGVRISSGRVERRSDRGSPAAQSVTRVSRRSCGLAGHGPPAAHVLGADARDARRVSAHHPAHAHARRAARLSAQRGQRDRVRPEPRRLARRALRRPAR